MGFSYYGYWLLVSGYYNMHYGYYDYLYVLAAQFTLVQWGLVTMVTMVSDYYYPGAVGFNET